MLLIRLCLRHQRRKTKTESGSTGFYQKRSSSHTSVDSRCPRRDKSPDSLRLEAHNPDGSRIASVNATPARPGPLQRSVQINGTFAATAAEKYLERNSISRIWRSPQRKWRIADRMLVAARVIVLGGLEAAPSAYRASERHLQPPCHCSRSQLRIRKRIIEDQRRFIHPSQSKERRAGDRARHLGKRDGGLVRNECQMFPWARERIGPEKLINWLGRADKVGPIQVACPVKSGEPHELGQARQRVQETNPHRQRAS